MGPVAWQMKFIIYSTIVRVQASLPLLRKPRQRLEVYFTGAGGLKTLETNGECEGLGTGLSVIQKQGAGSQLTDNLRRGVGAGTLDTGYPKREQHGDAYRAKQFFEGPVREVGQPGKLLVIGRGRMEEWSRAKERATQGKASTLPSAAPPCSSLQARGPHRPEATLAWPAGEPVSMR